MDVRPRWGALFGLIVVSCFAGRAHGASPANPDDVGQRHFGLLASVGFYSGFAGGVQLGTQDVGVRALAGYSPVLITIQESDGRADLRFFSGYQVAPDFFVALLPAADWARVGAQCGYRYHSLLGHGLALGGFGAFRITRKLEGTVFGGLLIFPNGNDELREHKHAELPTAYESVFPGANVNWGVNLGLSFFP